MTLMEKLAVLTDAAKYDAACTSSGSQRTAGPGSLGSTTMAGICHSFSADGRCISLLKVLFSNCCIYNCQYCVNRVSRETKRASFTPEELAELTIGFYRRNYIEGLFLSSGVLRSPDYTCEQMIRTLELLRNHYQFGGYIHVKAIPGADPLLIEKLGLLADRMSVNIELPSQEGLRLLAPDKSKHSILRPMGYIAGRIVENTRDLTVYPPCAAICPRRAKHADDHRRHTGQRQANSFPCGRALPAIWPETCLLFRLSPRHGKRASPRTRHKTAFAAGAPALSGGLAASLLRFSGR